MVIHKIHQNAKIQKKQFSNYEIVTFTYNLI